MRALVVGTGSAGRRHAGNLLRLGIGVEICSEWRCVAEYDCDGTSLPVYHDYTTALATQPALVVIANPTHLHAEYAIAASGRGCHVYLEKPAARTAREAENIRAAMGGSTVVAVGNQQRFNECLERLREIVTSGSLGRIIHVQHNMGEYLPDYHPGEDYRRGYAARAEMGGGVLLTQIHDLNLVHWLFGDVGTVFAAGGRTSDLDIDVEDNVSAALTMADGTQVALHMDYLQRPKRRTIAVLGERASVVWDYYANTLTSIDPNGTPQEIGPRAPLDRNRMFVRAMEDFLRAAAGGPPPRTTLDDAIRDLQVVDALKRSLASRAPEPVNVTPVA